MYFPAALLLLIPFSHERHARLKLVCTYCHQTAITSAQASYPELGTCLACHPGKFAKVPRSSRVEPERSVYVLAEFAIFSHARHHAAKIACSACHGNVYAMKKVTQVLPMTMKACVACHRENRAATGCKVCHALEQ